MKTLLQLTVLITFCLISSFVQCKEILFAGDVTLMKNIHPKQTSFFGKQTKDRIANADLFIWNAEFSGKSNNPKVKQFVFSGDSDIIQYFKFPNGVATVANNHSFDGGTEGFANLLKSLMKYDMAYTGLRGVEPEKHFLSATSNGDNYYILNFSPMVERTSMPYATPSYSDVKSAIKRIKNSDKNDGKIIVAIHDGVEGTTEISQRQRNIVDELSKLGVDIIAFTHTHTYIDPEKIGDTLVLWGLGNFVFGGNAKWRNNNDVRLMSVNPDTLEWKWLNGKTEDYKFMLKF